MSIHGTIAIGILAALAGLATLYVLETLASAWRKIQ